MTFPRRGEIYLVSFDPARGHESKKTRQALIIQNHLGNRYGPITIVAAVTSKVSVVPYPVEVIVSPTKGNGLTTQSAVELSQIRSIDRERLVKRLGILDAASMRKVDQALGISVGLVDL
jgi:mRNA interferase MazF